MEGIRVDREIRTSGEKFHSFSYYESRLSEFIKRARRFRSMLGYKPMTQRQLRTYGILLKLRTQIKIGFERDHMRTFIQNFSESREARFKQLLYDEYMKLLKIGGM